MNTILLRIAVFLLIALIAGSSLQAENRAAVTRLTGLAKVQKGGEGPWKTLKVRQIIHANDRIRTGPQTKLVIFYDGVEIRLGEKTEVTVGNLRKTDEPVRLLLNKGFTWINVKKPLDNGMKVVSPTAVAAVRGTKFSVSHDHNGTATCVCEGKIAAKSVGGSFADVGKGFSADFTEDGESKINDFTKLFSGLKVDNKFTAVIEEDPKMKNCTTCHKMTDLATDNSPDPTDY